MNLFSTAVISLVIFIITIIWYIRWSFSYWKRKGVHYVRPTIPFGNINPMNRNEHIGVTFKKQYDYFKSQGWKHGGLYFFSKPIYMPIDLEYVKNIFSRDFQYFTDRGLYYNEKDDPLSANIVNVDGYKWKCLRRKLTPAFTPAKMKMIFPTLLDNGEKLIKTVGELLKIDRTADAKSISNTFTMDVIISYVFGLNPNTLNKCYDKFRKYARLTFAPMGKLEAITFLFTNSYPEMGRFLGIPLIKSEVAKFFIDVVTDMVTHGGKSNISTRKNFVQILMNITKDIEEGQNTTDDVKGFTIEEIAAQASLFFMAGHETSATTLSFCLYELAINEEIQEKLRIEVLNMFDDANQNIGYDEILNLKYMNQVVNETLRKYPPITVITRRCAKDYVLPDAPHVKIDKGTGILIPVLGLQHDPEYFPDPEKFDPERFSTDNKPLIQPFSYLPFGEGPRFCIGMQLGITQVKVGLAFLLKQFRFSINSKTQKPLSLDPFTLMMAPRDGIWLNVEEI